jgi:hypothetical protein
MVLMFLFWTDKFHRFYDNSFDDFLILYLYLLPTVSKGNHLWEFIRDLLKDPKSNPHLLRWEEQETGVFRFVQSEAVAQMWGRKKNNPGMTYEKLSRAMR